MTVQHLLDVLKLMDPDKEVVVRLPGKDGRVRVGLLHEFQVEQIQVEEFINANKEKVEQYFVVPLKSRRSDGLTVYVLS